MDSRTVIQQKNLNSPSIEHFYPSRKSMSSDEFAFNFARKPDVNKSPPKMTEGLNYLPEVSTFEKLGMFSQLILSVRVTTQRSISNNTCIPPKNKTYQIKINWSVNFPATN